MTVQQHRRISPWALGLTVLALAIPLWTHAKLTEADLPAWYSLVPPVLAIALAFLTHRVLFSLITAILVGGFLTAVPGQAASSMAWLDGLVASGEHLEGALTDVENWKILGFVFGIMLAIAVMVVSGGFQGIVRYLLKFARTIRSTQLVTALLGLLIFIDDYANTMIVGNAMRPMTDQKRVSRAKLAFLVDATSAPVAGVALVGTWTAYQMGLFNDVAEKFAGNGQTFPSDSYAIILDMLSYRFYCILMIGFVLLNVFFGKDFGPMARVEEQARAGSDLTGVATIGADDTSEYREGQADTRATVWALSAIIPMAGLIGFLVAGLWYLGGGDLLAEQGVAAVGSFAAWQTVFANADMNLILAFAASFTLLLAVLCAVTLAQLPLAAVGRALLSGARASLVPMSILVLAWTLKNTCDTLDTGGYLTGSVSELLSPTWFPALVFIVSGITAFATGTSWGTMAILIPPVAALSLSPSLDNGSYGLITILSLAAILDGAIFGDHCSPISDTTIMSSIASGCHHIEHVRTQMPYSLIVAMLAISCGYLPVTLGLPGWGCLVLGGGILLAGFICLPIRPKRHRDG